jgi:hypothetical protein
MAVRAQGYLPGRSLAPRSFAKGRASNDSGADSEAPPSRPHLPGGVPKAARIFADTSDHRTQSDPEETPMRATAFAEDFDSPFHVRETTRRERIETNVTPPLGPRAIELLRPPARRGGDGTSGDDRDGVERVAVLGEN